MDESIESDSDKKLAKAHVDYIGNYLESIHNKTKKAFIVKLQDMKR